MLTLSLVVSHLNGRAKFMDLLNESARSSEGGGDGAGKREDGSLSTGDENLTPSASVVEQRRRLERKIEKLRDEITRNSISREDDIEEYLKITSSLENRPENPQITRIRQHFEKKNRKYTQETEQLQKKLEDLEQKLVLIDSGQDPRSLNDHGVLHNLGHGIKRTRDNVSNVSKNAAKQVIAAPFVIAQNVKRNMFGSADNIPAIEDGSNVGHSTFYDGCHDHEERYPGTQSERGQANDKAYDVPKIRLDSTTQKPNIDDLLRGEEMMSADSLVHHLRSVRQQYQTLQKAYDNFKKESENEMRNQQAELVNSRFKIQHLESTLNETMELHQNEVKQLKNDLNLIGARMDYQYNDRFKKIEEAVESTQDRIIRMETSWHENSERLLGASQNMWNALMLSGANIVVELLKIALYMIAVVLDFVKPLTGTR
ncbi:putative transmembrane and coiled-coil 2 protein domain-containing protein [Ditylenchus destructor]|uniref:Transmembrane and coiled-coil 2 protein domain-containing protein n=1 Tax=Ditylenchus destructor TaxID=166010 RepID=A0AAD4N4H6_9BILA|nr:putative transmembrane and coiled-coil 2 protein domain-containing protein [Ditylenchus destructor]